jgi:hypothetical protein
MKGIPRQIVTLIVTCFALFALRASALAQTTAASAAAAANIALPTVTSFDPQEIELGKQVALTVPELDTVKDNNHPDLAQAILYINGRPLGGAHARREGNQLIFELKETEDSNQTWAAVLGSPDSYTRKVDLTVGFSDGTKWPSRAHGSIVVLPPGWFWSCVIFLAVLLLALSYCAINSNILRDIEPTPGYDQKKTLSLARVQMAVWFFVVISSFLLIWSITGDTHLSNTALTLMGISLGTGLAATVVDSNKRTAAKTQSDSLTAERSTIITRIMQLRQELNLDQDSNVAALAATRQTFQNELNERTARLAAVNNQLTELQHSLLPAPAQGIALDLLTDANGAALHRFQMAAWTVVLVVIFLRRVYVELAMPELDATLLALMGISNGTYIGFKVPEKQA